MMVMKIQDEPSIVDDRWEKSYKGRKYQKLYNKRKRKKEKSRQKQTELALL